MKNKARQFWECVGNVLGGIFLVVMFWAFLGLVGIADGCDDDCTRSFKFFAGKVLAIFNNNK